MIIRIIQYIMSSLTRFVKKKRKIYSELHGACKSCSLPHGDYVFNCNHRFCDECKNAIVDFYKYEYCPICKIHEPVANY